MNNLINQNVLIISMIVTATFLLISFITMPLLIFVVKNNLENKLKNKIEFPLSTTISPWGFLGKYSGMAGLIIIIYLTERKVFKKSKYYKDIYLVKIGYTTLDENKVNICICFFHVISLILFGIFCAVTFYIGTNVYKT